ncbi:MAG TPA: hypothetical protein VGF55_05425, partial [Gemmataceae bacterium]
MTEGELFIAALPIGDLAERAAYLDRACAGDPALRQRVDALLAAFDRAGTFLQHPAASAAGPAGPVRPGLVLGGRDRLLEPIGEGGMGAVWMAQQTEPVRRPVAVKLIRPG